MTHFAPCLTSSYLLHRAPHSRRGRLSDRLRRYHRSRALSCISLGAAADTICPNVALPIFPSTDPGPKNCAWLQTLNASARTCSSFPSSTVVDFASAKSVSSDPGPHAQRKITDGCSKDVPFSVDMESAKLHHYPNSERHEICLLSQSWWVAPGSVNMQFDASNPLLTRASLVWRFVLDWVGGRGVSAVMHSALVTGRPKPP